MQPGTSTKHRDNLDRCQQQENHTQDDPGSANNHLGGGVAGWIVVGEEFHSWARYDSPGTIGRLRQSWVQIMEGMAYSVNQTDGATLYSRRSHNSSPAIPEHVFQVAFQPVHHLLKPPQGDRLLTLLQPEER